MQEKVNVRIDQTGHERGITQIDELGSGRPGDLLARFENAIAFDQHFAGRDNAACFDVEQAGGMQDNGPVLRKDSSQPENGSQQCDPKSKHSSFTAYCV